VGRFTSEVRHRLITKDEEWIVNTDERMAANPREFENSEGSTGGNSRVVGGE
jgi:hypothetical protein